MLISKRLQHLDSYVQDTHKPAMGKPHLTRLGAQRRAGDGLDSALTCTEVDLKWLQGDPLPPRLQTSPVCLRRYFWVQRKVLSLQVQIGFHLRALSD